MIWKQKTGITRKVIPSILEKTFKKHKIKINKWKLNQDASVLIPNEKSALQSTVTDIEKFIKTTRWEMSVKQLQTLKRKITAARKDANSFNLNKVFDDMWTDLKNQVTNKEYHKAHKSYSKNISEFNKLKSQWIDKNWEIRNDAITKISKMSDKNKAIELTKLNNATPWFWDKIKELLIEQDKLKSIPNSNKVTISMLDDLDWIKNLEKKVPWSVDMLKKIQQIENMDKILEKINPSDIRRKELWTSILWNNRLVEQLDNLMPWTSNKLKAIKAVEDIAKAWDAGSLRSLTSWNIIFNLTKYPFLAFKTLITQPKIFAEFIKLAWKNKEKIQSIANKINNVKYKISNTEKALLINTLNKLWTLSNND